MDPAQHHPPGPDTRWAQVLARDPAGDGAFYYSVSTTGVFCRPSCPSRQANRRHVAFHDSIADCERAGFRPCRRCRPDQLPLHDQHTAMVLRTCRLIEQAEEPPSLASLAASAGVGPHHFHRIFRAIAGVTPRDYASAHRAARLRAALPTCDTVTRAAFEAGFASSGRFYDNAAGLLGMTPSRYRAGGPGSTIRFAVGECSLGAILVACTAIGVCAILLGDEPGQLARDLQDRFPAASLIGADETFEMLVAQVVGMVDTPRRTSATLPLDIRGTVFQQRVWTALRQVPMGETVSYAGLATRLGMPGSSRAIAGACAANPIAVAVPCHRVVRTDGGLSGYRWGVERKRALLERERGEG